MWGGLLFFPDPPRHPMVFSATIIHTLDGPDLLFLAFLETARKTTKKARIFCPCRTPKILGKQGKKTQKSKEFLGKEKSKEIPKSKEIQKSKEKKIRADSHESLDSRESFQGSRPEPPFLRIAFQVLKIANRRFEAIRANRSNVMKIGFLLRIDSRKSPRFPKNLFGLFLTFYLARQK